MTASTSSSRLFIVVANASFLSLAGCTGADPSLVDLEEWRILSAAEDPFSDRPADASCDPIGFRVEQFEGEQGLGIETGPCPYVTAEQPSLIPLHASQRVRVRWSHDDLTAPDPGEAHVAVTLDDVVIFEERVAIPAAANELTGTWTAPAAVDQNAPVRIHLHNHGDNTWAFLELGLAD